MPSIPLFTNTSSEAQISSIESTLPPLLQTPSGLAIIEIQGTINASVPSGATQEQNFQQTSVGRLEFPLYSPNGGTIDPDGGGKWMKKVYCYVGKHQRLTGEVKRLGKPLAVIRKREKEPMDAEGQEAESDALEIVEIVKFKIMFSGRPEPVSE